MQEKRPELGLEELFSPAGFTRDTNRDGYPDELRARIVLADAPDAETWAALCDLAARLGLETAGLTFPLIVDDVDSEQLPIVVRRGHDDEPQLDPSGWRDRLAVVADTSSAIRALARSGPGRRDLTADDLPPPGPIDLARLFEVDGLLGSSDGGPAPHGTRLCIVIPNDAPLPRSIGIGLVHLCARVGLESGGIDLPIATVGTPRPGTIPLTLRVTDGSTACLATVEGTDSDPRLELSGGPDAVAALLERLARDWPKLTERAGARKADDIAGWLCRTVAGWTPEGRAAALRADLATLRDVPGGARLRVLMPDSNERAELAQIAATYLGPETPVVGPGAAVTVFAHDWSARWEVDRSLDVLRDRVLPRLTPGIPLQLTVIVSEPAQVRARLRTAVLRSLAEAGFELADCDVHVLDAHKAGLSWLREVVLPGWATQSGIERVAIRYRPLVVGAGDDALDLPIRWLQELFPADEIVAEALGLPLNHVTLEEWDGPEIYAVDALAGDGSRLARETFSPLWYRRRYHEALPHAGTVHVVTGGIVARQGRRELRLPVPTDLDLFWDYVQTEVLPRLREHILHSTWDTPERRDQPFFDELRIDVWLSESDEPLGIRQERLSAAESLHEDIYFNTLDFVEALGREAGERLNAPGPVLPFVHLRPGRAPSAHVALHARPRAVARLETADGAQELGRIDREVIPEATIEAIVLRGERLQLRVRLPVDDARIRARLAALAEQAPRDQAFPPLVVLANGVEIGFGLPPLPAPPEVSPAAAPAPLGLLMTESRLAVQLRRLATLPGVRVIPALDWSYAGRPIPAIEVTAPMTAGVRSTRKLSLFKPTLLIVARHHANEPASTTAALLLVERLVTEPGWRRLLGRVNVAILPFENPDGAALHEELQAEHPHWKHHPARYNAVGFEFGEDAGNPDSPYGEARVRDRLWFRWLPDVVVDNHGVPSHEWVQTFAGFGSPPRFTPSYWQVQALVYGIITFLDSDARPEHREAVRALRDAVERAVAGDAETLEWNRRYWERYQTWAGSRVPDRFPATRYREMIFYVNAVPADQPANRRNYALRFPGTTVLAWVSEVADETAHGDHLRRTAHGHLLVNRATLDLLAAAATPLERRILAGDSSTRITLGRRRPILLGR